MFQRTLSKLSSRKSDFTETLEEIKHRVEKGKEEFEKSKKELDALRMDYKLFDNRSLYREDRLRDHITNTSVMIHDKSVEVKIAQMEQLYNQVLFNISTISKDIEQEIISKKADLDKRVDYRIMDAEYRYRNRLDEKVREQEEMARLLHAITQDMTKIKENYGKIRKRIDMYIGSKTEYQLNIKEENNKHELLLLELKKYKILSQKEKEKAGKVVNKSRPVSVSQHCSSARLTATSSTTNVQKTANTLKILQNNIKQIESKYKRLSKNYSDFVMGRSNFEKRIYGIMNDSKTLHVGNDITPQFYTDEDRNRFIEAITQDDEILSYYYSDSFKTIHVSNIVLDKYS
jgi:hypothetical protein